MARFLNSKPNIDIDIDIDIDTDVNTIRQFQFSGLEGLLHHHIGLLITPDLIEHESLFHVSLFEYVALSLNDTSIIRVEIW